MQLLFSLHLYVPEINNFDSIGKRKQKRQPDVQNPAAQPRRATGSVDAASTSPWSFHASASCQCARIQLLLSIGVAERCVKQGVLFFHLTPRPNALVLRIVNCLLHGKQKENGIRVLNPLDGSGILHCTIA